ncbi:MAG: two-component regulator propeller domain-containing protein [Thermoanaerobaculia bacterium]
MADARTRALALLIALAIGAALGARAAPEPKFRRLSTDDGLSHDVVYATVQDHRGFLWVGTEGGVDRYDGTGFRHYGASSGLPDEDVSCIAVGPDGTIWVGTWGSGAARYDEQTNRFIPLPSLSDARVGAIQPGSDGTVWIGTYAGLNRFDPSSGAITRYFHEPASKASLQNDRIWALAEDAERNLWIGTDAGVDRLDRKSGRFHHLQDEVAIPASIVPNPRARVLYIDRTGALWIGTDRGVLLLDPARATTRHIAADPDDPRALSNPIVTTILEDSLGHVWIGTMEGGLNALDRATGEITRYMPDALDPDSLSHRNVRSLFEDRARLLWVGTRGGGLAVLDLKPRKFRELRADGARPALPSGDVSSVFVDRDGGLWVGMIGSGAAWFPNGSTVPVHYEARPDDPLSFLQNTITAFAQDRAGTIWVGTLGGLHSTTPGSGQFQRYVYDADDRATMSDNEIETVIAARDGAIWVGTRGGLNRLDPATGRMTRVPLLPSGSRSQAWIRAIHEDADGSLWIGTEADGLVHYVPSTGAISQMLSQPGDARTPSGNRIFAITRDPAGRLWIGTRQGIDRLDERSGQFVRFSPSEDRSNVAVHSIESDRRGNLWLGTTRGLLRFDPVTMKTQTYDESDGLRCRFFSRGASFATPEGELLFGSRTGLVRFTPESIEDYRNPPRIALTAFRVDDQENILPSSDRTLELPHDRNTIAFEFAALDFTSPSAIRYAWTLDGHDTTWIEGRDRGVADYRGLPPGEYVLRVRASNADGVWSSDTELARISIRPAFWATGLFRSLLALVILSLAWLVYSMRIRAIRAHARELEALVGVRTGQLQSANEELARLARTDALTGLHNRRAFNESLESEWRRAARGGSSLALLMLDVDQFKEFNDVRGHQEGDECLREVASVIQQIARRAGDVNARYGGEEFAVLLGDTELEAAIFIAESLRAAIAELGIPHSASSVSTKVTVSIGVAAGVPGQIESPDDLVRAADKALYAAKRGGRNRVEIAPRRPRDPGGDPLTSSIGGTEA